MTSEEQAKKIVELEEKIALMGERIDKLSMALMNTPSRFEFDSLARQQDTTHWIFSGIF